MESRIAGVDAPRERGGIQPGKGDDDEDEDDEGFHRWTSGRSVGVTIQSGLIGYYHTLLRVTCQAM